MKDTVVTVTGRLTAEPTWGHTKNGDVFANFDVAVNHGYFDRELNQYIETGSSFFRVSTFRNLAINVVESLHRATPVVVRGKLRLVKWENADKQGTTAQIEASAVGPDLTWGQADFTAVKRPRLESNDPMQDANVLAAGASTGPEEAGSDGGPAVDEPATELVDGEPDPAEADDEDVVAVGA